MRVTHVRPLNLAALAFVLLGVVLLLGPAFTEAVSHVRHCGIFSGGCTLVLITITQSEYGVNGMPGERRDPERSGSLCLPCSPHSLACNLRISLFILPTPVTATTSNQAAARVVLNYAGRDRIF